MEQKKLKASYTIEAAVIMPLYACLMVAVLLFFRIFTVVWTVECAMHEVAEEVAYSGEEMDSLLLGSAVIAKVSLHKGARFYVDHGLLGMDFTASEVTKTDVDLQVKYRVTVPVGLLGPLHIDVSQRAKHRRWVGYDPWEDRIDGSEYVYVAKYGEDYHNRLDCPYLNPSIEEVQGEEVSKARNSGGHRYRACSYCHPKRKGELYITKHGETYHCNRTCLALKRTIRRIRMSETGGLRQCPKCYGSHS